MRLIPTGDSEEWFRLCLICLAKNKREEYLSDDSCPLSGHRSLQGISPALLSLCMYQMQMVEQAFTNILCCGINEALGHKVRDTWCSYDKVLSGYTCPELADRVKCRQSD